LRATIIAAIITSPRHRLAILIVARFPSRLSRYIREHFRFEVLKCSPKLGQLMLEFSGVLKCSPKLGQLMLEFSGV
ncbi:hypothetical protein IVB57_13010, partial [Bradyrhizobium sp. CW9]|uniref:hypothetical protein n=1 Tax=Bradyrhizobium sp. CW9 TaxID=2782689 RepID=UPI001FF8A0F6